VHITASTDYGSHKLVIINQLTYQFVLSQNQFWTHSSTSLSGKFMFNCPTSWYRGIFRLHGLNVNQIM